jgi:hypothetical protein
MILHFRCPATNKVIRFEERTDSDDLALMWSKPLKLHCPYCPDNHSFLFREAYVEMVLEPRQSVPSKDARLEPPRR